MLILCMLLFIKKDLKDKENLKLQCVKNKVEIAICIFLYFS